jgi:type VI secretion system protein ImpE
MDWSIEIRKPIIHPLPPPKHATRRYLAIKNLRRNGPDQAIRCIDAADAVTPEVWGFIDGQEFDGLRDADDRFASVLEAFQDGEYVWFAWEAVRKVKLADAEVLLDQLFRPATVTMKDNSTFAVHLPLVYPSSHGIDDSFALGTLTDHICPDGGPTRCVGGKLLLVGDDAEVPLRECRMIEIR